jgi:hypothetical protein
MNKAKLVSRLEKRYGRNWKTPLSKDLGVHLSTVKRMFNQREEIPPVWILAINNVLSKRTKCE